MTDRADPKSKILMTQNSKTKQQHGNWTIKNETKRTKAYFTDGRNASKMKKRMELNKVMIYGNWQSLKFIIVLWKIIKSREWKNVVCRSGRWIENKALAWAWALVLGLFHLKLIVNFVVITTTIFQIFVHLIFLLILFIITKNKFGLFVAALDMNCSLQIWKIRRFFVEALLLWNCRDSILDGIECFQNIHTSVCVFFFSQV